MDLFELNFDRDSLRQQGGPDPVVPTGSAQPKTVLPLSPISVAWLLSADDLAKIGTAGLDFRADAGDPLPDPVILQVGAHAEPESASARGYRPGTVGDLIRDIG